ncbi:MAG: hypothetical protein ABF479_05905 [Gluconacetobacter sp.]|mgnify:CR=1 FL=1
MTRTFSDNQYPDALIAGAPFSTAMLAIRARLQEAFAAVPDMSHEIMVPRPTKSDWDAMTRRMPMCAIGWQTMTPSDQVGQIFEGELVFPVFLLTRQPTRERQYLGDGRAPGLLGMVSIAIRMLHAFTIPDVGTCKVRHAGSALEIDWIAQDIAMAVLAVSIPNVSFDDAALAAQLDDFLQLGETFAVDGADLPQTVVNVRGDE